MYSRRQFLQISGGFVVGSFLGGAAGVLATPSPLDRFMNDMRTWDTSGISKEMLMKIADRKISEEDRHALYEQAFLPNKEKYVHRYGVSKPGRPGAFQI